jgi:hypothetical protein
MIPVIPAGLEPATYALGKRRSDPAELWDRTRENVPDDATGRKVTGTMVARRITGCSARAC